MPPPLALSTLTPGPSLIHPEPWPLNSQRGGGGPIAITGVLRVQRRRVVLEESTTITTLAHTQVFRQPCPGKHAYVPDYDQVLLTPEREIITVQAGQCGNSSQ